jgi:hypothetical protein
MGELGANIRGLGRYSYECPRRCEGCFNSERFRKPTKQLLLEILKWELTLLSTAHAIG